MKRWAALVMLVGCTSENPSLVVERQAAPLAQATDSAWTRGSVILAGDPSGFTFPQTLALRLTIVDDEAAELPTPQLISRGMVAAFGSGHIQLSVEPVCQPMYCTAEVSVTAAGSSMLELEASGSNGGERGCFYYAVVDGDTDTDVLRAELETQQRDCRFAR